MPHYDDVEECYSEFESQGALDVSLIIPAYNARETLSLAVSTAIEQLSKMGCAYEVIIAEDGSTDGTDEVARTLARTHEHVVHLHSDERCGKGRALTRAIELARGDVVVFMDADVSAEPTQLRMLIESVREGCDVAIGSRKLPKSEVERPLDRRIATAAYNIMVRVLLGSRVHDHQCGFKAFRRERILPLLDEVKDGRWFWDTEVLVRAQQKGWRVCEIAIHWTQAKTTRVSLKGDVVYMGLSVLRLFWELKITPLFRGRRQKF